MQSTNKELNLIENHDEESLDKCFTHNPTVSFFQPQKSKSYYPFARNTISIEFKEKFDFDKTVTVELPYKGDLISRMFVEIDLPTLTPNNTSASYVNNIGMAIFDWMEIEVAGQVIGRLYSEFAHLWNILTTKEDQRTGVSWMTRNFDNFTTSSFTGGKIFVPLYFWFNTKLNQAFPIGAITHNKVIMRFKTKSFSNLWVSDDDEAPTGTYSVDSAKLLVDYYLVSKDEVKNFRRLPHHYLIHQVQRVTKSIGSGTSSYTLDLSEFRNSVTEIIWVLQRSDSRTSKDWFNYSDSLSGTSDDPLLNARIYYDGDERTELLSGKYFRTVEPFNRHTIIPNDYIYMYLFSLHPENTSQPSGVVNMGKLHNISLYLELKAGLPEMFITVYAINYKQLAIANGQAYLKQTFSTTY
jgi:hypothetical protein